MQTLLEQILQDPALKKNRDWRRRNFAARDMIIHEGHTDRKLYWVESGCLRVLGRVELDNKRKIEPGLNDLCAGDIFGELSLFDERPRSASVMALEEGILIEIDSAALSAYLEQHKELGYDFLKLLFNALIQRLSTSNHRVSQLLAWGLKAHQIDKDL